MSTENDLFENAATAAKSLPEKPDDNTLLELYALYKQGSGGDVSGDKPGFFDFVGAAKYEAWKVGIVCVGSITFHWALTLFVSFSKGWSLIRGLLP